MLRVSSLMLLLGALAVFVASIPRVSADCAGCCCCSGHCAFTNPCACPCPPPPFPGGLPKCGLQHLEDSFVSKYKAVVERLSSLPDGTTQYPSKTVPPPSGDASGCPPTPPGSQPSCGFTWSASSGWTSGFFPGLLWQLANNTGDPVFANAAPKWTAGRESEKTDTSTHDIGFMVFGSFGNGIQLGSTNKTYADVIVEAAHSLALRYNHKVGMIRSWGDINDDSKFEVIIDNLLNLELIFWASAHTGNETLKKIAESHVIKTAEFWIRPDGSTAHLCVFDPKTGKLQSPCTGTPQGLAANSTWARGQAWGIYGFTMAHRYTSNPTFLECAMKCAGFFLKNTGVDKIPLWDFDAKSPENYKDSSGAAITASALLELAVATGDSKWRDIAAQIVSDLGAEPGIFAPPNASEAVVIANRHDCEYDTCTVIESDYYTYEAVRRLAGHFP